jgi:hypothetical protein
MRDIHKALMHVEYISTRGLEPTTASPRTKQKPSSSYVWRAPVTDTRYPEQLPKPKDKPMAPPTVTTRALKVTAVLDAAAVAISPTPDGQSRSKLTINCEGKIYTADISTKSLRNKATIAAHGANDVFVMVQGKLRNNEIVDCGLIAQVKVTKETKGVSA